MRQGEGGCSPWHKDFTISNPINAWCYEKMRSAVSRTAQLPRLYSNPRSISYSSRCFSCLFKVQFHLFCLSIHNLSLKSSNGGFHPNCTRNRCFRAWSRAYPWQELGFTGPDLAAHQRRRSARPDYRYWHLPYGLARIVYSCGIWRDVPEDSGP